MQIDWVIPCRYVEVHDNLGTIVGAGIDTLWVHDLPQPVQVVLAVRLVATAEELSPDVQHTARNIVRNPNDEVVSELSGDFAVGVDNPRVDWLTGLVLPTAVQFPADVEGAYTIEHRVDQATSSVPIHVVLGPPPGAERPA